MVRRSNEAVKVEVLLSGKSCTSNDTSHVNDFHSNFFKPTLGNNLGLLGLFFPFNLENMKGNEPRKSGGVYDSSIWTSSHR